MKALVKKTNKIRIFSLHIVFISFAIKTKSVSVETYSVVVKRWLSSIDRKLSWTNII